MSPEQVVEPIKLINYQELIKIVIIISIEVVGLVQWTKNFNKGLPDERKGKRYTITTLIICAFCSFIHTNLVPTLVTYFLDFFLLSLSVSQLAWDVIVKGVPKILNSLINKAFNIKNEENKDD